MDLCIIKGGRILTICVGGMVDLGIIKGGKDFMDV